MSGCLAVIPARWASSRLPGKPLADIAGLPMVEHVRRRVLQAQGVQRVLVATDDERVVRAVQAHGGEAVLTGPARSGTERVARVAASTEASLVINVQGDMPLVDPAHVEQVAQLLSQGAPVATLAAPLDDPASPHLVKVVLDARGRALYFSRQPIPHRGPWLRHLGLYGFRAEVLQEIPSLPDCALARSEDLEQLRWMHSGIEVRVAVVAGAPPSVDTPEQLARVRALAR